MGASSRAAGAAQHTTADAGVPRRGSSNWNHFSPGSGNIALLLILRNSSSKPYHACAGSERELAAPGQVSMLPALLLGASPGERVLDMCAAPGSKTAQLLELVGDDEPPAAAGRSGAVVANDVDAGRAQLLTHRARRHTCRCAPHLVSSRFPPMSLPLPTRPPTPHPPEL